MTAIKKKRGSREIWRIDFWWKHADGSRQRIKQDSPINTKRGAEEFERKVRAELAAGTYRKPGEEKKGPEPVDVGILFVAFASEFLKRYAAVNNKPSEICSKEKNLRLYLTPYFGTMPLREIGVKEIDGYKAWMLKEGYAVKTINNTLATLSKLFATAVEYKEIQDKDAPKVKPLKKGEELPINFFTVEQAGAFAAELKGPLQAMVLLGLHTGLRVGELRGLQWADIDFKTGKLTVRRNVWRSQVGSPKGGRSRVIGLNKAALSLLKKYPKHSGGEFIFCYADGTPYRHNHGYKSLKSAAKRAGILFSVGFHTLRHSFASHLVMSGKNLKEVQEVLGHADMSMTQKYAHLSPEVKQQTTSVLDVAFAGLPTPQLAT